MRSPHIVGMDGEPGHVRSQADAASSSQRRRHPLAVRLSAVALVLSVLLAACGGDGGAAPSAMPGASAAASIAASAAAAPSGPTGAVSSATVRPAASAEAGTDLCLSIEAVEERLAALRAVELRLPNRVALEIELGKLQAAFDDLQQADLGPFAGQLETPLTRLAYRLAEVELAVEDFRTNSRPQNAVAHVETDAGAFDDELAAFAILARC